MSLTSLGQTRQYVLAALLATLLISCRTICLAEQLPIQSYTTAHGLARDYINRIKQDSRGFIWFCTNEGISRFDGYEFTNYGVDDGLPHRIVTDFLETRDGAYLFATYGGVVEFNPLSLNANGSHFTMIPLGQNEISRLATRLLEEDAGAIWCATVEGVYRLTRTEAGWQSRSLDQRSIAGESIKGVNALAFDRKGSLWIGTAGAGLYRRQPNGNIEHYTIQNGLSQNGISDLLLDHTGRMWVGTGTGLTLLVSDPRRNDNIAARVYTAKDGLLQIFIESLYQSSDGRLWVGTRGGLFLLVRPEENNGWSFRRYTTANGLRNVRILSIAEDRDNNLWLGAESGGAMKMPLGGFTSYFEADQLGNGRIEQIFSDPEGRVYAVADGANSSFPVIARFDGRGFVRKTPNLPPAGEISWGWENLVARDRKGDWWIPTARGLFRFSGNRSFSALAAATPRVYTARDGLSSNEVFDLFVDARGDLWFCTLGSPFRSLHRLDRASDSIHIFSSQDNDIPPGAATAFANDWAGNLWLGFYDGGVCRYLGGRIRQFTEKDGLPPGRVRGLLVDARKRLWIGTASGLARVDDPLADRPQFVTYTTRDGLASNQVTTLVDDRWGQIYVGTGRGLNRLDPSAGKIKHYTTADGLADNFINVSMRDSQGALWFGTYRGVSRIVPGPDKPLLAPPIIISGLKVAGARQPISELGQVEIAVPELNYRQNQIQIDFLSIGYSPGDLLRYQFKLEGSGNDWSAPSEQRTITLANLASGSYRFLVRAVNSDGSASSQPASVRFTILPPIWRRWWFLTIAAALIGLAIYAADRYRVARLLELERVRTRIATDLHDDIGASLSRMAVLSEVVKRQTETDHRESFDMLTDIADSARGLVDSMSDIVWSIDPRKDDLRDVVSRIRQFAADVLEAKGIDWEFRSPDEIGAVRLSPERRRHLYLIFKEAINNAARHSECKSVSVDIALSNDRLLAEVTDDGRGFAAHSADEPPLNGRGGNGLRNMQMRAAEIGGQLNIRSSPRSGTRITLLLPLRGHRP